MKLQDLKRAFLNNLDDPEPVLSQARPAAVLVPLEVEHGVWLTRRSTLLPTHAGQVSFPGGKIEAFDVSPAAAALREAQEEVGLDPACVEILVSLNPYETVTGFNIVPVVGVVPEHVALHAASNEVDEVFSLPFSVLLNPAYPVRRKAIWRGCQREFWVWPHEEQVIWGATAEILRRVALMLRTCSS